MPPATAAFAAAYAGLAGTLIDLDHFLIARLNTGEWRALRAVLRDPSLAVLGQERIFAEGEVGVLRRLFGHVFLGGALVGVLAALAAGGIIAPVWAVLTAVVLYVHVLTDIAWDVRNREDPV